MGESVVAVTTQIFLIRHGESEWNSSRRYTGQRDVPLSDLGKKQAQRLAERLKDAGLAAVYTSPLRRARETAQAIGQLARVPVILEPGLKEIHHGLWEGLTAEQVSAQFPAEYALWRTQPHRVTMPQGESLAEVAARAEATWRRVVAEQRGSKIAVCSHDAVMRVLLLIALGLALEHFWKWGFGNASLTVIEARGDAANDFRLVCLNDTAHLAGVYSEYARQAL
jgi:alpha-ribazole phosphatase